MKRHTIATDIYKLSSTLYGAERFKLIIESIRHLDEKNEEYSMDDIPSIDIAFDTNKERENYRKIMMDFYVVNVVIVPRLVEFYFVSLSMGASWLFEKSNDYGDEFYDLQLTVITLFFKHYEALSDLSKLYNMDLLTSVNRLKIEAYRSNLETYNSIVSEILKLDPVNKISEFSEEELKEAKEYVKGTIETFRHMGDIDK